MHDITFDEDGQATSALYGDTFFSRLNGLRETEHVFLEGNGLASRFASLAAGESFTIAELGLGCGLNVVAAVRLFRRSAPPGATLKVFSVEKHPLTAGDARRMLAAWPELDDDAQMLTSLWPEPGAGRNPPAIAFTPAIHLRLLIGDAVDVLRGSEFEADAWFLDGFSPALNPAMWSSELMALVAARTVPGGTFATYTAAGWVRRHLDRAGFTVERRPGHGGKRHMSVGVLANRQPT